MDVTRRSADGLGDAVELGQVAEMLPHRAGLEVTISDAVTPGPPPHTGSGGIVATVRLTIEPRLHRFGPVATVTANANERWPLVQVGPLVQRADRHSEEPGHVRRVPKRFLLVRDVCCHADTVHARLLLMKRDTQKSKEFSETWKRTRYVRIEREADTPPWPEHLLRTTEPPPPIGDHLEIRQRMDGAMACFSAVIRIDISDGELRLRDITYIADDPMPMSSVGARALRSLRHGDLMVLIEEALTMLDDHDVDEVLPFLTALLSSKKRPGRGGTPDIVYADIARKRVEAEERWPGKAIRNMVSEWPDLFTSKSSVDAKVHRARTRGMLTKERTPRLTPKAEALLTGGTK
jgi:hypothetical protein